MATKQRTDKPTAAGNVRDELGWLSDLDDFARENSTKSAIPFTRETAQGTAKATIKGCVTSFTDDGLVEAAALYGATVKRPVILADGEKTARTDQYTGANAGKVIAKFRSLPPQ